MTLQSVGGSGGQAAGFAYDLARSVVYTRQGNPAWSGQERDGEAGPIRSERPVLRRPATQPDWVDLNKVAIPQADEQQRLLANLITTMNLDRKPLPRFWYLPRFEKAAVVMTGDDHATRNGTAARFDTYQAQSPAGCSVAQWGCVRATSYVYPSVSLSDAQAAAYEAAGFEVALHVNTDCANWTPSSLEGFYSDQLATFAAKYAEHAGARDEPDALHRLERLHDAASGRARPRASASTRTTTTGRRGGYRTAPACSPARERRCGSPTPTGR